VTPQRIVIVRLSHLGDVVHSLPIYHALRLAHPAAEIAWVVQPEFREVLESLPGLDHVFVFDRRGGLRAWPRLRRELALFRADWTVDAQGNLKSSVVTLCTGARRRSGFERADWTERLGAWALNDPAPRLESGTVHAVGRALHLARHVVEGFDPRELPDRWLQPRAEDLERAAQRHEEYLGDGPEPAWILHLGAPEDVRTWPVDHYRHLAAELSRRGRRVLVLSGPAEARVGSELATTLGESVRHWIGQRGLRELAAFFSVAATRGARMLACDSGPLHLAAACGLRVSALYGPQDPARTGPWPPTRQSVVRADPAPVCAPCSSRICEHEDGPVCMSRIDPERVAQTLLSDDGAQTVDSPAPEPELGGAHTSAHRTERS
jgi:ADP-heptose:LPS heptosyltransferase